ncbi:MULTISPECIES: 50S ribosomal protein L3 [unclassified Desulfurobacterium]|uniref:50S ribosomal protein L3 n=1 Tax=unclassified Desulfurobacterium TaxID=2639089 RepID=UPI0003B64AB7|nr:MULTISPECIES: 50S ribosomal protein L3 [unclassified Desulfurobacterium]
MKGILGRKIGMTQVFTEDGKALAVTVIEAGPCTVVQKKTEDKDGYTALQLGFMEKNKAESKFPKPLLGHFKKAGIKPVRFLKEVKFDDVDKYDVGDKITVEIFQPGEKVDVTGTSKGRGFAGYHKRWGFGGGRKSHGSDFHEGPGSIGACAFPGRVHKGKKMAGHYGNAQVTVKNLEIVDVIPEKNLILVKGAIPGHKGSFVVVKGK